MGGVVGQKSATGRALFDNVKILHVKSGEVLRPPFGMSKLSRPKAPATPHGSNICCQMTTLLPFTSDGEGVLCDDRTRPPLLVPLTLLGCRVDVLEESPAHTYTGGSYLIWGRIRPHVKLPTEMSNFPTLGAPPLAPGAQMSRYPRGPSKFTPVWGPTIPPTSTDVRRALV